MNEIYIKKDDLKTSPATYELFNKLFKKDIISIEEIIVELEEAYGEIDELQEKLQDLEESINDYYKPKSPYEIYGVSEDSFH